MMQFFNKPMSYGPQIITGSPLLAGEVGFAYATNLNSINGAPPYSYRVSSGTLPPGLAIMGASIIGTPTTNGAYTFSLVATDSKGASSNPASFSLTIVLMLAITTTSPLPAATQGTAYSTTLVAANGVSPYTWAQVGGSLDPGLIFNTATGVISGTPTTPATYTPTFQVTDSLGYEVQKAFSLTVNTNYVTPSFSSTSPLPGATNGSAYSFQLVAINGTPPYTFTLNSQSGPNTVSVSSSGLVTFTPSAVGTDTINVSFVDTHPTTIGPQAFTIAVTNASVSGGYKYTGLTGNFMLTPQYGSQNSASVSNNLTWLKKFAANPCAGFVWQMQYSDICNGSSIDNTVSHAQLGTGNYAGFQTWVANMVNLCTAYIPGKPFAFYVNTIEIWGAAPPTGAFTCSIPNYLLNCGGSLTVPTSFGSGTTTAYTLPKNPNNQCGFSFYAYNSPAAGDYGFMEINWWDPASMNVFNNDMQALSMFVLGTSTAYNAGTTYTTLGQMVSSGGNYYVNISASNTGNAVTNTSFWLPSTNPYLGMTLDQCPQFFGLLNSDETSANFNAGPWIPPGSGSNACTYQNYFTGYFNHLQARKAAFPHTMIGPCLTYVITGANGVEQDASTWTAYITQLNSYQGIAFSQADIQVNQFVPGSMNFTNAETAYIGANPDTNYSGNYPLNGPTSPNLIGVMPFIAQIEPEDYGGSGLQNAAQVNKLIASCAGFQSGMVLWSVQDDNFNQTAWAAYIQPTFTASSTQPTQWPVPTNLPQPSWHTLKVGSGGFVRGLNIAADGTMVSRTDTNGAYLYNGSTWNQLVNYNSIPSAITSGDPLYSGDGTYEIQIAPSNTSIFYMMYLGYVFSSSNKGTTWTQTAFTQIQGLSPNDNYGQYGQKMAIDPQNSNIVYVGTEANGLLVTSNGGTSWSTVSGVPTGTGAGITGILFDPSSSVVGGVKQGIYACSNGTGVYHSTNGGSTWTLTSSGPTGVIYAAIDTSGNYYAVSGAASGSGSALMKYSSGAWSTTSAPPNSSTMQAVAINPFNISEVVIICAGGQIAVSYNAGSTWSAITNPAIPLTSTDIPWIAAGNYNPGGGFIYLDSGGLAFSPVTNGQLILSAGTGVWTTTLPSSGFSSYVWTDMSVGIEQMVAIQVLVPPVTGASPILCSWDRPFFKITNLSAYPSTYGPVISSTPIKGGTLDYASSSPSFVVGIADVGNSEQTGYSTDGGATWTYFASIPPGVPATYQGGCIAASTPQNIIWSPAGGTAPSYTTNQGASWNQISVPGVSSWTQFDYIYYLVQRNICADRVNANTFYLYFAGHGVFTTTNGGASWSSVYSGSGGYIESNTTWAGFNSTLSAVPGNAGHLFYTSGWLGSASGLHPSLPSPSTTPLYRSINGGVSWTAVANVTGVSCFGFGPVASGQTYPTVYIYGWVSNVFGVWQSVDDCNTWTNLGAFPTGALDLLTCISGDPNIQGRVYVGFSGGGYAYYG